MAQIEPPCITKWVTQSSFKSLYLSLLRLSSVLQELEAEWKCLSPEMLGGVVSKILIEASDVLNDFIIRIMSIYNDCNKHLWNIPEDSDVHVLYRENLISQLYNCVQEILPLGNILKLFVPTQHLYLRHVSTFIVYLRLPICLLKMFS